MRVAIFADGQVHGKVLAHYKSQTDAVIDECTRRNVDVALDAGDVFEHPNIGDSHASTGAVAEAVLNWIWRLRFGGISYHAIPGNHDMAGAGSRDALTVISMDDSYIYREPSIERVDGEISVLFLPWSWASPESPEEIIERLLSDHGRVDILLGHVEVTGAVMQGARTCEPSPGKWQISRNYLESLVERDLVGRIALGHFHKRQDLTGRGTYVGALMQHNFGEEGNPAGFEIYDTETAEVEWVELDAAPKYRTVRVRGENDERPDGLDNLNNILRVRFEDHQPSADEIRRLESQGVRVEQVVEAVERVQRVDVPAGIMDKPHDLIRLWAEAQTPPFEQERVERMLTLFDDIHADSLQPAAVAEGEDF